MSKLLSIATDTAIRLRDRWVRNRPVLYHGTRYIDAIVESNSILCAPYGDTCVSLTRRPETAIYFASLPRDDEDERGAVLILDRQKLQAAYRIDIRHCDCFGGASNDEAEEAIWKDVVDLRRFLIDVVYVDDVRVDIEELAA
ncbi:hypothetical protein [Limoniibacter endophyticus]|uniref:Uncharacterized protein n=1 Tax=Limoniibacter endophyticus TaxID=1565040 RepID=A0A8J3DRA5_9HYPH|nr:hypothetical protein [Limoniibacter endophyticus]GHC79550.1 hypothetical protein GCM10010136_32200 [Limoniibacter endophyticus]